jgi:cobalt-zinc-cadmium efflux system outer membrane protein
VAAGQSVTALQRAERERAAACQSLVAAWGGEPGTMLRTDGSLEELHPPRPVADLLARIDASPELARFAQEELRRRLALGLARAQRQTDLTATAAVRRLSTLGDTAVVVALSLPLPLSDRNQGGIRAAEHSLGKLEAEKEAARLEIVRALYATHQEHQAAFLEATGLRERIVPSAERAFEAIRGAYQLGKLGYLEVLDAQRTLLDTQSQYFDSLAAMHRADITLHRLTGSAVTELGAHGEPPTDGSEP